MQTIQSNRLKSQKTKNNDYCLQKPQSSQNLMRMELTDDRCSKPKINAESQIISASQVQLQACESEYQDCELSLEHGSVCSQNTSSSMSVSRQQMIRKYSVSSIVKAHQRETQAHETQNLFGRWTVLQLSLALIFFPIYLLFLFFRCLCSTCQRTKPSDSPLRRRQSKRCRILQQRVQRCCDYLECRCKCCRKCQKKLNKKCDSILEFCEKSFEKIFCCSKSSSLKCDRKVKKFCQKIEKSRPLNCCLEMNDQVMDKIQQCIVCLCCKRLNGQKI